MTAATERTAKTTDAATGDLAAARRVLRIEADALTLLSRSLGAEFEAAVDLLKDTSGRSILTGMGKSGHVARKIAATLASTGTPAIFVHPGEASHGDLGMLAPDDTVVGLSNSGETPELGDIVAYTRRFGLGLIGLTSKADSTLAQEADVALVLPTVAEACPMGLAPTTSTTLMLALGDALAVALLERRGFTADDFQVLHPGGRLGKELLRVREIMHDGDAMPLVAIGTPTSAAIVEMTAKRFGCVGVVDAGGRLTGIFTDGDLARAIAPELLDQPVDRIMTREPKTIRPRSLAAEALGLMNSCKITALFAVEDGAPVGILHMHDCLRAGVA